MTDDRERKAAEAKFKKSERATEGAKAMSEYNAERQAERAKTVRLKALREAKEAAESGPRRSGATSKSPGLTLSLTIRWRSPARRYRAERSRRDARPGRSLETSLQRFSQPSQPREQARRSALTGFPRSL